MSKVSDAVNGAVVAIAAQVDHLSRQAQQFPLSRDDAAMLADLAKVLAVIENNRVSAVVSLVVGRKALDKLPPAELAGLLRALADE